MTRRLCSECIGDAYLRGEVDHIGARGQCDYCGQLGSTISIDEACNFVQDAFERHYQRTPTQPSTDDWIYLKHSDRDWERDGDPANWAIVAAAEIDEKPANDIRRVLYDRYYDFELEKMGEEMPFAEEAHYAELQPDDIEFQMSWRFFEDSLKTEARFFNTTTEATLRQVFEGIADLRRPDGNPVIVESGPDTALATLYRARMFQDAGSLQDALKRPDIHIGPPPPVLAKPGRMNAHGIAVFYGATDPEVAISEVRPPVGSRVIVGEFVLLRRVRLLDVEALRSGFISGSVFDSAFIRQLERTKFLGRLADRISRPVMPNDEPLEYLVTQVVAEFLASNSTLDLDGILYASVQAGSQGKNVMLFHSASSVARMELGENVEIDVSTGFFPSGEEEPFYYVRETAPPQTPPPDPSERVVEHGPSIARMPSRSFELQDAYDARLSTLRLNLASLQVHHVKTARFDSVGHTVHRSRTENGRTST